MPKKFSQRAEDLRRALAQEAARIMAEHGIEDFLQAKRKAADRLGVNDVAVLPKNVEIEAALRAHQRLFGRDSHDHTLKEQRRIALDTMRLLNEFQPRLVGSVLTGTATNYSDINLHLFADRSESVAIRLIDLGVPHQFYERRVKMDAERSVNYPALRFEASGRTVDATVFPIDGIRQSPYSPVDGRPMKRADAREVSDLVGTRLGSRAPPARRPVTRTQICLIISKSVEQRMKERIKLQCETSTTRNGMARRAIEQWVQRVGKRQHLKGCGMRSDTRITSGVTVGRKARVRAAVTLIAQGAASLSMLATLPAIRAFADAPAADTGELGEIVVTAQRRTERLQDVPMSIQAFSQEALDQQGIRSVDDLTRVAPGVTFIRNGMSSSGNYNDEDSDISIRGIDSTAGAATTGIYVDDTPIQTRHLNFGTVNPYPALFDLERVEVLKGPQGTLFGAGSKGGTVRFITPEPSLTDYSGYARAEYGKIDGGGNNYEAGRRVRRADHRRRARLSRQRLVPRGWRLGESRELHAVRRARSTRRPSRRSTAATRWSRGRPKRMQIGTIRRPSAQP